jgi:hypothetical protein
MDNELILEPLIITLHDPPTGMKLRYPIKKAWQWCLEFYRQPK